MVDPLTTTVGGSVLTLQDNSTDLYDLLVLGTAAPGVPLSAQCPLPSIGYLLAKGDVLNVNLSAACTAGRVRVNAWGCEE